VTVAVTEVSDHHGDTIGQATLAAPVTRVQDHHVR
jgi:hypothetical protein